MANLADYASKALDDSLPDDNFYARFGNVVAIHPDASHQVLGVGVMKYALGFVDNPKPSSEVEYFQRGVLLDDGSILTLDVLLRDPLEQQLLLLEPNEATAEDIRAKAAVLYEQLQEYNEPNANDMRRPISYILDAENPEMMMCAVIKASEHCGTYVVNNLDTTELWTSILDLYSELGEAVRTGNYTISFNERFKEAEIVRWPGFHHNTRPALTELLVVDTAEELEAIQKSGFTPDSRNPKAVPTILYRGDDEPEVLETLSADYTVIRENFQLASKFAEWFDAQGS